MTALEIDKLLVCIGGAKILREISWCVQAGEILGLVGESGSGKSMSLMSVIDLLPKGAVKCGSIKLAGQEISHLNDAQMQKIRGNEIGIVFQEPMTALNPVLTIGHQVGEVISHHRGIRMQEAIELAGKTLERVGLAPQDVPLGSYPHQLSGGQRQRVMIAMAIALKPKVILADEPTTALDVMTQKTVLDLLARLAREDACGLVLVSHDLALVSQYADQVVVMKDGEIVEVFEGALQPENLQHPYSKSLFEATVYSPYTKKMSEPDETQERTSEQGASTEKPALKINAMTCEYRRKEGWLGKPTFFRAVDQVDFEIAAGETLALVGQSGCGKSTLARAILGLQDIKAGDVEIKGEKFTGNDFQLDKSRLHGMRRKLQIVFQDPYGSFNPRNKIGKIISEPFFLLDKALDKDRSRAMVSQLLTSVSLKASDAEKYPHQLSGGQRQRVAIARALATSPDIIVLDEAVSSLDVCVRAQILDLLVELRERMNLAYLFISHDLSVVRGFSHRVMVMKEGKIIEAGDTQDIFTCPQHEYTKTLLAAAPRVGG